jgi:alcohol dehydrogenase class IV
MNFEFHTATRIIFGAGKFQDTGSLTSSLGSRALIVSGLSDDMTSPLIEILIRNNISSNVFKIDKEPTIEIIKSGIDIAEINNCDMVIGFGGGSAIDAGKAIAALATNPGDPLDYLEVIGSEKPLQKRPLPFVAIPTTAGTGAEVTRNAVLASPKHHVKVSLRSALMTPKIAIIDPELTRSLPSSVTASTGLDALTQCIEPFVSHLANPLTDAICREGIRRAAGALQNAFEHPDNLAARTDMCLASLLGGLALANAKLGAVHGFAGPLGGMYHTAPHGVICGRLLPLVMAANVNALLHRDSQNAALDRYDEVARIITADSEAYAIDGVTWIQRLAQKLALPTLSTYGVEEAAFQTIIEKAQRASSMKGNPITLTDEELHLILQKAIH